MDACRQYAKSIGDGASFVYENWGMLLCCAGILGGVFIFLMLSFLLSFIAPGMIAPIWSGPLGIDPTQIKSPRQLVLGRAQRVGEAELEPARHARRGHAVIEQLVGAPQQRVDGVGRGALLDRALGQLADGDEFAHVEAALLAGFALLGIVFFNTLYFQAVARKGAVVDRGKIVRRAER